MFIKVHIIDEDTLAQCFFGNIPSELIFKDVLIDVNTTDINQ